MSVNDLVKVSMFAAITAVFSQVTIPIGLVPISLGTFAVYLSAVFLTPKNAFYSQLVYLMLGIIGLPVFNNFGVGIGHLLGPTGGFAISYPLVALISSLVINKTAEYKYNLVFVVVGFILSTIVCYFIGTIWFSKVLDMKIIESLPIVMYPFIVPDAIKIAVCSAVYTKRRSTSII